MTNYQIRESKMFISLSFVGVMLFAAFFAFTTYQKEKQLNGARVENQKLLTGSSELLKANEMLSAEHIKPEHVKTYVEDNPSVIDEKIVADVIKADPEMLLKKLEIVIKRNPNLITPELAAEILGKNPELVTDEQMAAFVGHSPKLDEWINEHLKKNGLVHNWNLIGERKFNGTINGSSVKNLPLKISQCTRCGMFHKYVLGHNDPRVTGWEEGYFIGANPIELKEARVPSCIKAK